MSSSESLEVVVSCGQATVSALLVAYLNDLIVGSLVWIIPVLMMVLIDLVYGIRAARLRGERVTTSSAARRTFTKIVSYFCWIIMAVGFSIAFNLYWMQPVIMGIAVLIELISIINNILITKGKQLDSNALLRWAFKKWGKVEIDGDVVKPIDKKRGGGSRK